MESKDPNPKLDRTGPGPLPFRFVPANSLGIDHLELAADMLQLASDEKNRPEQTAFFMEKAKVAALIAIAQVQRETPFQGMMRRALDETERSAHAWEETAAQHASNESFYRDLLVKIGKIFGEDAYTAGDGSIQEDVIVLKIPDLVTEINEDLKAAMRLLDVANFPFCDCKTCEPRRKELKRLTQKYMKS